MIRIYYSLCLLVPALVCVHGSAKISIKRVDKYNKIWDDKGSGAYSDVSIWRPFDIQTGFYALGDVAVNSYSNVQSSALMVRELEAGALKQPVSLTQIWKDKGSGANADVAIYRMNPSAGYTCLGNIANNHHSSQPPKSLYRCVKTSYLTNGRYDLVWNDKGSGASRDVSIWRIYKDNANVQGLGANTFLSHASHGTLSGTPKILDSRYTVDELLIPAPASIAIKLYPAQGKSRVWWDRGSGARDDFSCWRPKTSVGTYRMGDVPVKSHGQPNGGFISKAMKDGILTSPVSYNSIWNDAGSGARQDGSFWRPVCPSGFRYVSFACSSSHNQPPLDAVSCVKAEHTVGGKWEQIWTDRGSGANHDVKVFMAHPLNNAGQGVNGLGALRDRNSIDTAYVLKSSSVRYINSKPVKKYEITTVNYNLDSKKILDSKLDDLEVAYVENNSPDCQTSTSTVGETVEEAHTWSVSTGIEIGVEMSVEAGIPGLGSATAKVSTTVSSTYGTEDAKTTSKSLSTAVTATVRPCQKMPVTLTGRRYTTDVPYTAKMKVTYTDGTTDNTSIQGTYRGVTVSEVTANLGNPTSIAGCTHPTKPCGSN